MNKHITGEEIQMVNKQKNMLNLSRHQVRSRYNNDRDFFIFFGYLDKNNF